MAEGNDCLMDMLRKLSTVGKIYEKHAYEVHWLFSTQCIYFSKIENAGEKDYFHVKTTSEYNVCLL